MEFKIAVVAGDGIGPDIVEQGIKIFNKIGEKFGHAFSFQRADVGGCAYDKFGTPLPEETLKICKESDSVLLGAVGGDKWDNLKGDVRPEAALLGLRKELNLFSNLRPVVLFSELSDASPLKPEIIGKELDIMIVRELTGGIYFGERGRIGDTAFDTETYSVYEIERIIKLAFSYAMKRGKKLTIVDKANILETSRLWREVGARLEKDYPEVECSYMYVDNAAMQLIRNPSQFDVIVTSNMFGDILSDEASMLVGSIGMLASASLGDGIRGMYEPIHGSAPDIAGQDKANPIATILSVAMMLRYSFDLSKEADAIENAVKAVLEKGYRTADIFKEGMTMVGTEKMGDIIAQEI